MFLISFMILIVIADFSWYPIYPVFYALICLKEHVYT